MHLVIFNMKIKKLNGLLSNVFFFFFTRCLCGVNTKGGEGVQRIEPKIYCSIFSDTFELFRYIDDIF